MLQLFLWLGSPSGPMTAVWSFFITLRHTTLGRNPLDEWSARHIDLHMTTQYTHKKQTSMSLWDSNPQSQQASGRVPRPYTARPLGDLTALYIMVTRHIALIQWEVEKPVNQQTFTFLRVDIVWYDGLDYACASYGETKRCLQNFDI
jgi:hypothetical protein